jgi:hypothetical protein
LKSDTVQCPFPAPLLLYCDFYVADILSDLQTWCVSQGKNATYAKQSCFALSPKAQSYVLNLASGCTAMPRGRMAMLPSPAIVAAVQSFTKQFTNVSNVILGLGEFWR